MSPESFERFVAKVRNAYGLAQYKKTKWEQYPEVVRFYHEAIGGRIPQDAEEWIFERILDTYEKFPDKFHRVLKSMLWQYYERFPEKRPPELVFAGLCRNENCHGGWLYWFARVDCYGRSPSNPDLGRLMECVVPCRDCRRAGRDIPEARSYAECIARGLIPRDRESVDEYRYDSRAVRASRQVSVSHPAPGRGRHGMLQAGDAGERGLARRMDK